MPIYLLEAKHVYFKEALLLHALVIFIYIYIIIMRKSLTDNN